MKTNELLVALSEEDSHYLADIRLPFEERDWEVTTATSSGSAADALETKHFDLVITNLPDILKKAKEVSPSTTVIILTSSCKATFVLKALRLGADDCFIEPLDRCELRDLVAYCLRKVEGKRRNLYLNGHGEKSDGDILNILKIATHDIRGSLLSLSAALKLINRGYYGKMDEGVATALKELLSKTVCLTGLTEEYLGRLFCVDDDLEAANEGLDLKGDVLTPVLEELSTELKEHPIRLDHRLDRMSGERIHIKASRIGLKAVFRNLIRNALHYGGEGSTISLGFEDRGHCYRFNVYNSGNPIPEQYRSGLFSRSMPPRMSPDGDGSTHGMGLGLYLTRRIIEKQGGTIWYKAEENGSNFLFTLPSGAVLSLEPSLPINSTQHQLTSASL